MTKIKPNSWEHYCHLIATHDFSFVKEKCDKSWIILKHSKEERDIERLRLIYDDRGTMYNQYNPCKK